MMDITKSREEFEAWLKSKMPTTYKLAYETENYCDDESMVNLAKATVLDMRTAWQASRESIVIDLPQKISEFNRMPDNGAILLEAVNYDEAIDDCAEAIKAAGIRIKGESE